jgi:hypothetical protein
VDGDDAVSQVDRTAFAYDTARTNEVLCDGAYKVTSAEIERFRRLMGYPEPKAGEQLVAPASMGLIYGLRLGWEHSVFPPGAIRMGDDDVFGVPARPGDELTTQLVIVEKFARKGRKFMKYEMSTRNQRNELVCSVTFTAIVP